MKENLRKLLAVVLVLTLLSTDICAVAEAAATLMLPAALKIIDTEAFYHNKSIEKVVVPDGTTEIRSKAFADSSLTELVLPDSLTFIAEDAFDGCSEFALTVPEDCYAYDWAVENGDIVPESNPVEGFTFNTLDDTYCELTGYTGTDTVLVLPATDSEGHIVQKIADSAFKGNTALCSVTIPGCVEIIGGRAFYGCTSLTNVSLPEGLTTISSYAFSNCTSMQSIHLPSTLTSISSYAFLGCRGLTSVVLPTKIKNINAYTFYSCTNLTSVILPEGLTIIYEEAFGYCTSLQSIHLPDSITTLVHHVFDGCSELSSVNYPTGWTETNRYSNSRSYFSPFYNCPKLTSIVVPEGITTIPASAFYGCSSLTSIDLPSTLTTIERYAFYGCSGLTSIALPSNITNISEYTFYGCAGLTSVSLPEGLTTICRYAFAYCTSLQNIHLPDSITTMYDYVFSNCSELTSVNYPTGWVTKGRHFSYYVSLVSPFYDCPKLTSIVVSEGVTTIPAYAFYGCSSLTSIDLPSTLTTIERSAFDGCNGLTSVDLPNSLLSIEDCAFNGCTSLASIVLPSNITTISYSTFSDCTSLTNVSLPEGLTTIEYHAFEDCTSLQSIHLPDSITTLSPYVFYGCSKLSSINYPTGWTTTVTDHALAEYESPFYACPKLTSIVIPEGVTTIPAHAFHGCSGLKAINIGSNVTSIATSAFTNCSNDLVIYGEAGSYAETYAAQQGITFSTGEMPTTLVNLSGKVVTKDATAIPGVSVTLWLDAYTNGTPITVTTNENGVWTYAAAKAGHRYLVTFDKYGYSFGTSSISVMIGAEDTYAQNIIGAADNQAKTVIHGNVVTEKGSGIEGISVCLHNATTNEAVGWAVTDASGAWSVYTASTSDDLVVSFDAEGYTFSPQNITVSAEKDSSVETVVATLAVGDGDAVGFTIHTPSITVGTEAHFTVDAVSYDWVRLIVDGIAYEKYPVYEGSAEVYRIFTRAGTRSVQFQGCTDDIWGSISEAQAIEITSKGVLDAPEFSIAEEHAIGTSLTLRWNKVEHAERYTIYLYHEGRTYAIGSVEADAEPECVIDAFYFQQKGQYSVEVLASGYEYSQSSCSVLFDVVAPTMSLTIETPLPSSDDVAYIAGDTFYIKVLNPDQQYVQIRITQPNGEHWYYPEGNAINDATIEAQYPCEKSGKYIIEAFGYVGTTIISPEYSIKTARVDITVTPSQITDVCVGTGYGNQLISDTAYIHAKTNNAVQYVEVYEGENLLTTLTYEEHCTEVNYVRTFTGSIAKATEGKHTIRFEAYDSEGNVAQRSFTYYAITDAATSMTQYPVENGLSLLKYPDLTSVEKLLYVSDALTVYGTYGDLYYVKSDNVYGYVPSSDVFAYSAEDRAAINLEIATSSIIDAPYAYYNKDGETKANTLTFSWTFDFMPTGCYVMAGLVSADIDIDSEVPYLTKFDMLTDTSQSFECSGAELTDTNTWYNAIVRVYAPGGQMLTRAVESVYIYETQVLYIYDQNPSVFDKFFAHSAVDSDIQPLNNSYLLKKSADFSSYAYNREECLTQLEKLGFNDVTPCNYNSSEAHSVAFCVGWKDVLDENGELIRLYAVIVRGTQGTQEWASNLYVGTGNYHHGFNVAAADVATTLAEYIKNHKLTDATPIKECKVWITGHSRGAAVTNLLAARYLRSWGIESSNIYAYTFATPNSVKGSVSTNGTVIHNYVLDGDIVPYVPLSQWGYHKIGTTYVIENKGSIENNAFNTQRVIGYLYYAYPTVEKYTKDLYPVAKDLILKTSSANAGNWCYAIFVAGGLSNDSLFILNISDTHDMSTYRRYIYSLY